MDVDDRELLEKAAKAAGVNARWREGCGEALELLDPMPDGLYGLYWNPLIDGGDALWLAVKLRMSLHVCDGETLEEGEAPFSEAIVTEEPVYECVKELHGTDPYAATRRAIVRAAASIAAASEAPPPVQPVRTTT
jgi:hypothetical protein